MIATHLVEAGYEVREAASNLQAPAALEADPWVDLVVVDFARPGMNGAEAAEEVRKRGPKIPVLFVTGYADAAALTKGGVVGPEGIVRKPFRDGELERKVAGTFGAPTAPRPRLVSDRGRGA